MRFSRDRFGGDFPVAAFERYGVTAEVCAANTSDNHMGMLPLVNAGRVQLLDLPELLRELRGLERRRGTAGKDRVDHRRARTTTWPPPSREWWPCSPRARRMRPPSALQREHGALREQRRVGDAAVVGEAPGRGLEARRVYRRRRGGA
jgi:hypothetical protein